MANIETDKKMLWAGRILTGVVAIGLAMSAGMKLTHSPELVQNFAKYGYAESVLLPIALAELGCVVLYLIPQTAVLGGLFMTAYLGGAVDTHVRAGEGFAAPIVLAVIAWAGLYAREARLRALVPLRKL